MYVHDNALEANAQIVGDVIHMAKLLVALMSITNY